jgi:hypothetical protein
MDIRAVARVFERINSSGTVLTGVDLMRAATRDPEFELVSSTRARGSATVWRRAAF